MVLRHVETYYLYVCYIICAYPRKIWDLRFLCLWIIQGACRWFMVKKVSTEPFHRRSALFSLGGWKQPKCIVSDNKCRFQLERALLMLTFCVLFTTLHNPPPWGTSRRSPSSFFLSSFETLFGLDLRKAFSNKCLGLHETRNETYMG